VCVCKTSRYPPTKKNLGGGAEISSLGQEACQTPYKYAPPHHGLLSRIWLSNGTSVGRSTYPLEQKGSLRPAFKGHSSSELTQFHRVRDSLLTFHVPCGHNLLFDTDRLGWLRTDNAGRNTSVDARLTALISYDVWDVVGRQSRLGSDADSTQYKQAILLTEMNACATCHVTATEDDVKRP